MRSGRFDQAGNEQGLHVVGTSPTHCATRFMDGFEVEPVGDSRLEVDHHVSAIASPWVSESMELGERDDRQFDGSYGPTSSFGSSSKVASVSPASHGRDQVPSASIRIDAS